MKGTSVAWRAATAYARLYGLVKDTAGFNLPGLGWMLRRVSDDHVIEVAGHKFFFDHRIAGAYDRMVAGSFNEPETHLFLRHIFSAAEGPFTFIDVGANIGEFLITAAAHPKVQRAIGFEPHALCAGVCESSVTLNQLRNVVVSCDVVGDGTTQAFTINPESPNASGIGPAGRPVPTTPLDSVLDVSGNTILLIDVEGAEPLVLNGARKLIAAHQPLVIFEYNELSRQSFSLSEIKPIFGPAYDIFRLRRDGKLDRAVEDAWNCVAVPLDDPFRSACELITTT